MSDTLINGVMVFNVSRLDEFIDENKDKYVGAAFNQKLKDGGLDSGVYLYFSDNFESVVDKMKNNPHQLKHWIIFHNNKTIAFHHGDKNV